MASESVKEEGAELNLSSYRFYSALLPASNHLTSLDLSDNELFELPSELYEHSALRRLTAKKNRVKALPEQFSCLQHLVDLNLSGNCFDQFPTVVCELASLESLHLGGNSIEVLPPDIQNLQRLKKLYLGGNKLETVPSEVGKLLALESLTLCDNRITHLPKELTHLKNLIALQLHKNRLQTLPEGLVRLTNLRELSLRENPLVLRFVQEWPNLTPSLLELSARAVRASNLPYSNYIIPEHLVTYLDSAQCCDNLQCTGVYFNSKIQNVKFVDFCGKYRIPLMQYLCSSNCSHEDVARKGEVEDEKAQEKLKRVLLG